MHAWHHITMVVNTVFVPGIRRSRRMRRALNCSADVCDTMWHLTCIVSSRFAEHVCAT